MHLKQRIKHALKHSFFLAGLLSIAWFILRTGTKPSRITYPCQQMAASAGYLWIIAYLGIPIAALVWIRQRATPGRAAVAIAGILFAGIILSTFYFTGGGAVAGSPAEITGPGEPVSVPVNSDIFVVKGSEAYRGELDDLLSLMQDQGLFFYQMSGPGAPQGLIGKDDVIILKVNSQWEERGGTSTDLVKAVISAILAHPEGFEGEIVVADNGQGRGSFQWPEANAEDTTQSIQDVVDSFSGDHRVSTYLWDTIRSRQTVEYDQGDDTDGYVVNDTPNPRTGMKVTYPKFTSAYGTKISFRYGIWENGAYNNTKLKLINMPVLKTHVGYAVTGSLKHYVGVGSVPFFNPHASMWTGGLGTALAETRYPDLTILDATWVNAIPKGYEGQGPQTPYEYATRTDQILASTDPVALDYYAAKHILIPLAVTGGYAADTMDPDSPAAGSFGSWLKPTYLELLAAGYPVTMDEGRMSIRYRESAVSPAGLGVFRPTSGINWFLDYGPDGDADYQDHYGNAADLPLIGDFNNDGTADRAVFRAGEWIIDYAIDGSVNNRNLYGIAGDIPLSGDFTNDGISDRAVFRASAWYNWILDNGMDGSADTRDHYGMAGDIPLSGDFNNDGIFDRAVFRGSTWNNWIIDYGMDGSADTRDHYGMAGDIPFAGDFNNDGISDRVVFRNGEWIADFNMDGSVDFRVLFGQSGDVLLVWNS